MSPESSFEQSMKERGFVEVPAVHVLTKILAARVPTESRDYLLVSGRKQTSYWAPRWAVIVAAYGDVDKVRKALHDTTYRAAAIASDALGVLP